MQDFASIIIITLAIAIGFYLGRLSLKKKQSTEFIPYASKSYFQGLNYLLNEQPDKAVGPQRATSASACSHKMS